jgi:anti-sigma regulatory factor (Ser/Thr protein kinase)
VSGANGATHHLTRDPDSVRAARDWLTGELERCTDLPPESIEMAGVMVSELATNVLAHTRSEYTVSHHEGTDEVRVEVADEDGLAVPVLQPIDPRRVGGNGMRIVDALSDDWGLRLVPDDGKVVWFVLTL